MTSIFSDEQRASLMDSMTNPESNARKMIEQNAEIGISPDVTTEILNKYATYGANTGIGNLGGGPLVEALNEHYRNQVDAPLQQDPPEMFIGGLLEGIRNAGANVGTYLKDVFTKGGEAAGKAGELVEETSEAAINSPVTGTEGAAADVVETTADELTRRQKIEKYLEENPVVAKQIFDAGGTIAGILAKEAVGQDDTPASIRAPRPRFQPGQVRTQRIGMEDGGTVLNRKMFLGGGEVDGPGGEKEDLVPIWASPNEYVVSAKGVRRMGGGDLQQGIAALDRINFGDERHG